MIQPKRTVIIYFLMILSFLILLVSFLDVIFDNGWIIYIFGAYAFLLFLILILIFLISKRPTAEETVESFGKTLKGKLYHFKCPNCQGIFAIKKSKHDNKKPFSMNCPDCGEVAIISPTPRIIEEEIPEKKSVNVNFKCSNCGEGLTIWAEGTELYSNVNIHSCPYCGLKASMDLI